MATFILVNRPPVQTFIRTEHVEQVVFNSLQRSIIFRATLRGSPIVVVEDYNISEVAIFDARVAAIKKILNS